MYGTMRGLLLLSKILEKQLREQPNPLTAPAASSVYVSNIWYGHILVKCK